MESLLTHGLENDVVLKEVVFFVKTKRKENQILFLYFTTFNNVDLIGMCPLYLGEKN